MLRRELIIYDINEEKKEPCPTVPATKKLKNDSIACILIITKDS
jgi:hypothetical protein